MIAFGPWSILLLLPALQALAVASLLAARRTGQPANLLLAGLLLVLAGLLTPYIIGYAGAYDAWPWLTYAPFQIPLAIGPLAWGHVRALTTGRAPPAIHAALPAAQFGYQAVLFALPLETRWTFAEAIDEPVLTPLIGLVTLVSLCGYGVAALRHHRDYRRWLLPRRTNLAALDRLRTVIVALGLLLALRAGFQLTDWFVDDLDYFEQFPLYLALALLTAWLSIEAWRQADVAMPRPPPARAVDWPTIGAEYRDCLIAGGWWRDAQLDLDALARRLGSNTAYVSRALNEGLGTTLPDLLARLRTEAVAERLADGDARDMLTIALDCGFGSKASFNRAFKAVLGETPSAFRRRHVSNTESLREAIVSRRATT